MFQTTFAPVDTALKRAFVDSLDLAAIIRTDQEISGYAPFWHQGAWHTVHTRQVGSVDHDLVAEYLKSRLEAWGYTVTFDSMTVYAETVLQLRNIVATRAGRTTPTVVVGGHYDSCPPCPSCAAPGAEDNGSGTSVVMELARVSRNRQFERTLQFVLFDFEEAGLLGSQLFVEDALSAGRPITCVIVADMVGWYGSTFGFNIYGDPLSTSLMSTTAANVARYTPCMYSQRYYGQVDDHTAFQDAGIPGVMVISVAERSYPYYHTADDTWDKLQSTIPLSLQAARAVAATLADVAGMTDGTTTGVPHPPAVGRLLAAYPNPFNPRITLRLDLPEACRVRLGVYDFRGRLVRELADGQCPSGSYTFPWDGTDAAGREMSSGSYLVKLQAGARTESMRIGLVR